VEAVELRGPAPRARPLSIRGRHFREGQERSLAGATSGHLESRHGNHRHRLQPRGAGDWRKHRAPLRVLGQRVPGHVCCGRSRDDPRRVCRQAAYAPLYQADQIVNLSMTRAATLTLKPPSMRGALGVSRVKILTMGLVCRREAELAVFQPRDYFNLFLSTTSPEDARLYDKAQAAAIIEPLAGWTGPVQVKTERKTKAPSKLMDLPVLQQRAARWGWTAKQTLETAQSLYETHRSRPTRAPRLATCPKSRPPTPARCWKHCGASRSSRSAAASRPSARVSPARSRTPGLAGASHHAIVPNVNTRQQGAECYPQLSADERQLFKAITRGYLAAIDPDWVYDRTEISVQPNDRKFAAASAIDIDPGWRAAVGPDHNFSKRTKTYALYTRVNMEDPIFGLICWKDL